MSRQAVSQASRMASRTLRTSTLGRSSFRLASAPAAAIGPRYAPAIHASTRLFSSSPSPLKGIMPETDDPSREPPKTKVSYAVAELSDGQYHELADEYLENVVSQFEEVADARDDVDVEFSAGVLTITFPGKGTYVVNKQPPNKQIWLSSPISGPKRYDWCLIGEGQGDKEGTASGDWIYARDGSSLSEVFADELGVSVVVTPEE